MDFALAEQVPEPECERLPEMDEEKTVLLVDDSEINLVVECELLRSFSLQVDTAASAGDALRLAEQRVYDLVLLDIRMPDMDGYELAKRLRRLETYRAVPLLALTADAVGGIRERALDAGMNDCITKPLRPDRLYQVLRRYFALAVDAPETLATDHGGLFCRARALATLGGDREQLAALCRRAIQTPVILVSSCGEFEYAKEGLVLGAFDYIVKPFREEQLNAVLSRAAQSLSAHTDEDSQYALVRETFETLGIPVQEDGFVHTLAAFLAAHLNGVITMEQAAEYLGLSKDYFGKQCRSHTGMAFGALYNQVRVAYARQLLRESTDKAGEISNGLVLPRRTTSRASLRTSRAARRVCCGSFAKRRISTARMRRAIASLFLTTICFAFRHGSSENWQNQSRASSSASAPTISCGIGQTCSACMWKRRARPAWSLSCRNPA